MEKITAHMITLKEVPERKKKMLKLFKNSHIKNLPLKLQFHEFNRTKIPSHGSTTSHLTMYQHAIDNNLPWIFIMEDNVKWSGNKLKKSHFKEILKILEREKDKKCVVYLGAFFIPFLDSSPGKEKNFKHIYRINGETLCGGFAHFVNRKACEYLLKNYTDKEIHTDTFISEHIGNRYIVKPVLFHRDNEIKSTQMPGLMEVCRSVWLNKSMYRLCENMFFDGLPTSLVFFLIMIAMGIVIAIIIVIIFWKWL